MRFELLLLVSLAAGCKAGYQNVPTGAGFKEPLRFEFRPPRGARLTERVVQMRTSGSPGTQTIDRVELRVETLFERKEAGWLLSQRVLEARYTRNGEALAHPLAAVLPRFTLRLQVAEDGRFVRVLNPEEPGRAVDAAVEVPEVKAALLAYLSPEAVEARSRREWEGTFGAVFARNLREGQRLYNIEVLPGLRQERPFMLERTVVGTRGTDLGEALVLALRCPGEPPSPLPAEWSEALAGWRGAALESAVACEGEQMFARGTSIPVRREVTVRASIPSETGPAQEWTFTMQSSAEGLE